MGWGLSEYLKPTENWKLPCNERWYRLQLKWMWSSCALVVLWSLLFLSYYLYVSLSKHDSTQSKWNDYLHAWVRTLLWFVPMITLSHFLYGLSQYRKLGTRLSFKIREIVTAAIFTSFIWWFFSIFLTASYDEKEWVVPFFLLLMSPGLVLASLSSSVIAIFVANILFTWQRRPH